MELYVNELADVEIEMESCVSGYNVVVGEEGSSMRVHNGGDKSVLGPVDPLGADQRTQLSINH